MCNPRRTLIVTLLAFVAAPIVYGQQPPAKEDPLVDARIVTMRGDIRAPHTLTVAGTPVAVPETCAFKFVLPPGKKALHWHQLTRETFTKEGPDAAKHYCEATFEVGVPSRYATASTTVEVQPLANWRMSSGYFWMWWTDPVNWS